MEIVRKGPITVVGLRVEADFEGLWTEMPRAWTTFRERYTEIDARIGDRFIDVCVERNDGVYAQLVCAEVSALDTVPEGMTALEIPERRYVHHRHRGPAARIADAFGAIYDWAADRGLDVDDFKLDIGYTPDGAGDAHDLFVRLTS